jgi:zinc protease
MSVPGGAERHVLDNGLTVLLKPARHAPVATFWVWYRVGSRDEGPGHTGASHWVEHMAFKGTEHYPEGAADRLIARAGGAGNGMTWLDWTAYYATLPADQLQLAIDIEADRMSGAAFDAAAVESERAVILEERAGAENSPLFRLGERLQRTALRRHPYRHEVLGERRDLRRLTRADLWAHYRQHYVPANAVVVAVGDIDTAALLAQVAARFGAIESVAVPARAPVTEPRQRRARRLQVSGSDPSPAVALAWPAPAAGHPDFFAFQVLDSVLGGAKSLSMLGGAASNRTARLYRALAATGLAASVSSGLSATREPFLYTISAIVNEGRDPARVEAVIHDTVAALASAPLTPRELARARQQARAQFAYSAESVTDQGFWLGFAEMVADQAWLEEHLERLAAVTPGDVQRVAARWLVPEHVTVGHYAPRAGG